MWFLPFRVEDRFYVVLAIPPVEVQEEPPPPTFSSNIRHIVRFLDAETQLIIRTERLNVTERYVKEVGHDIASSVQAVLAKLRNISQGLIPIEFVGIKAKEVESEVMSMYRIAEGLGVAVDSAYQIREFDAFDGIDCINKAISQHAAEASERHIRFELRSRFNELELVGDGRAFEQALGHLFSNAVKYSFGNSAIRVTVTKDNDFGTIGVRNVGMLLPDGTDRHRIWEFGFRGIEAKAAHVNGSGIGLFTVRKIILAHHAQIVCGHDGNDRVTWFEIKIPTAAYMRRKHPEVFIDALADGKAR